jgi:hypothetical protein
VALSIYDLAICRSDEYVTHSDASPLLSLPFVEQCIFFSYFCHMVCFSRGFLPRFWHSQHISSHSIIFSVSSFILLSFCAFRILEYLLIRIFS